MSITATMLVYANAELTAQDFAIMMEQITPSTSGVLYGCTVKASSSSVLSISSGWAFIKGRLIRVSEGTLSVSAGSSSTAVTNYLILKADLGNDATPCTVYTATSVPSDSTNFNTEFGTAYLTLATFKLSSSGISSVTSATKMTKADTSIRKTSYYNASYKIASSSSAGAFSVSLYRSGNVVHMDCTLVGNVPKITTYSGTHSYSLSGYTIPSGYRPIAAMHIPSASLVSYQVYPTHVSDLLIGTGGGMALLASSTSYLEHEFHTCWITSDPIPS